MTTAECQTLMYYILFTIEIANPERYLPAVFDIERSAEETLVILLRAGFYGECGHLDDDEVLAFGERQLLPMAKMYAR